MDVTGYFDRIGYRGAREATFDTLGAVVAAHNRSIPSENLDPLLGVPVADLGPAALTDKLVHRRRGGYCYEHNGLLGYVLEALGYDVDRLAGRVVWQSPKATAGGTAGSPPSYPLRPTRCCRWACPGRTAGSRWTSALAGRRRRRRSG